MFTDTRGIGNRALMPAPDPQKRFREAYYPQDYYSPGQSQGPLVAPGDPVISLWTARFSQWRNGFEQRMSSKLRRYWELWRAFDRGPSPSAGQEWRDRTVVPQAFKEMSTRIPRIVLGLWGGPEPYSVQGRGYRDIEYEEMVRVLLEVTLDTIGQGDPKGELLAKRLIDGETYCQIMGHVWWKVFWRNQKRWVKTKIPSMTPGKKWDPVELLETVYDNVDITWLPISSLAIDLYGHNRWRIERIRTSFESLKAENDAYLEEFREPLYPGLAALELEAATMGSTTKDSFDEPRDTERWPLDADGSYHDPSETPVELWLCWDNVHGTLTKIANRHIRLDHGQADTPDGLDPYVGVPAVPIPGQPYGDSILNWTGPLHTRQTRLTRARMDQTLLNMFTQYLVREHALTNSTWFWRPGGVGVIRQADQSRPIADSVFMVPQKPMPPEAYQEELYTQRQSESVAAADELAQGLEGTSKSRDVSAAEINQRSGQGALRYELEILYKAATWKRPILGKVFDLLRFNLTTPRIVRIFDDHDVAIDLTQLDRPIDIMIGDLLTGPALAEKLNEIQTLIEMAKGDNAFAPWLKPREILIEALRSMRSMRRATGKFVKSEEEFRRDMAAMVQAQGVGSSPALNPASTSLSSPAPGVGSAGLTEFGGGSGPLAARPTPAPRIETI